MSANDPKRTSISSSFDYSRLCDTLTGPKILGGYNVEIAANPAGLRIFRNVCVGSRIRTEAAIVPGGMREALRNAELQQELVHCELQRKVQPKPQREEEIALGFSLNGYRLLRHRLPVDWVCLRDARNERMHCIDD
jgi:hypothetical protein